MGTIRFEGRPLSNKEIFSLRASNLPILLKDLKLKIKLAKNPADKAVYRGWMRDAKKFLREHPMAYA